MSDTNSLAPESVSHVGCYISGVRRRDSTHIAIAALSGEGGDWALPFERSPALNLTPENAADAPAAPAANESFAANTPLLDDERLDAFRVALAFAAMVPALAKGALPINGVERDNKSPSNSSDRFIQYPFSQTMKSSLRTRLRALFKVTTPTGLPEVVNQGRHRGKLPSTTEKITVSHSRP